jgi:hypothetical protein
MLDSSEKRGIFNAHVPPSTALLAGQVWRTVPGKTQGRKGFQFMSHIFKETGANAKEFRV